MTATDLQGLHILVTRPREQAESLSTLIKMRGGIAVRLPALKIEANNDAVAIARCANAADYDWLVFISRNAAEYALPHLPKHLPASTRIAAIGQATAATLTANGFDVSLLPENGSNSEALLQRAALANVKAQRILIVRGNGGRELLANSLRERGASVEYAEVYARTCPVINEVEIISLFENGIDVITAASGETLKNLVAMISSSRREALLALPVIIMSKRLQSLAQQLGFTHTAIVADDASDAGLVEAVAKWRGNVRVE